MAKIKCKKQTKHVQQRLEERLNIRSKSEIKGLCHNASRYGYSPEHFIKTNTKLYNYLKYRENYRQKRVKLYKGIVFIFFKTSDRCLTAYPLPEEFKDEIN